MPALNNFFPPAPTFTESDIPDLSGKVFIVTGGSSGVGLELSKILYQKNGTIYIATRSAAKIQTAITEIRNEFRSSSGQLHSLILDLSDLSKVKQAVHDFLSRETRLNVLFNNAGIMNVDGTSPQGHELQVATNCLGPYLLTTLLEPLLQQTARSSPQNSVRVVYLSSLLSVGTPKGGIHWDAAADRPERMKSTMDNYMQSKVGSAFLARDAARRLGGPGVIATAIHPGLVKSELQRNSAPAMGFIMGIVFKPAKYGAYTEVFAGLSPEVTAEKNGSFILPWGRFGELPEDIEKGMKTTSQGGTGIMDKFVAYCNASTMEYR